MIRHKRRAVRPVLERMEGRDLPSGIISVLSAGHAHVHADVGGTGGSGGSSGGQASSSIGNVTDDPSAPATPHEIARRKLTARFAGFFLEGPPRTVDQARQFRIRGPGSTNFFLHSKSDMVFFTPSDPTGQISGAASLIDRNTSDGAVILLNLGGSAQNVDRHGRPTQLLFTVNGGGGSGGIFASSVGSGTIDIRYNGNRALVVLNGTINTTGVGNPLLNFLSKNG